MDKTLNNTELRSTAASLRLKPKDITLISAPLGAERNGMYPIDRQKLGEFSEALRKDTMAEYVKRYPEG